MIAPILHFITDAKMRSKLIISMTAEHGISKQTIRHYLCLYLTYMNIAVLAPQNRKARQLTNDEKNMRRALNKFFYTTKKQSLMTAYTLMLKEKYCDNMGMLAKNIRLSINLDTSTAKHAVCKTSIFPETA